jgi:hypothetical protein
MLALHSNRRAAMVSDEDVQRIIAQDEAGVGALLEVYGPVERSYFAATASTLPTIAYTAATSTVPVNGNMLEHEEESTG